MRFIDKNSISPDILKNLKERLFIEDNPFKFDELKNPDKNSFRDILITEQKYLCCYCEQEIENHPLKVVIEHFLPQSKFHHNELDYYNLHLSCTQKNNHCDTLKKDELIINLLLHPDCEIFFRYTLSGEILPNTHEYKNFTDFRNNISSISTKFQSVIILISVLDLNNKELVNERFKTINDLALIKETRFDTIEKIDNYLRNEKAKPKSKRFPSLINFFLEKYKVKLN